MKNGNLHVLLPKTEKFEQLVNILCHALTNPYLRRETDSIIVIGAGIVGATTGKGLIKKGYEVVFVDKNPDVIRNTEEPGLSCIYARRPNKS